VKRKIITRSSSSSSSLSPINQRSKIIQIFKLLHQPQQNNHNLILLVLAFEAPIYISIIISNNMTMNFDIFYYEIDLKLKIFDLIKSTTTTYNIYGNIKTLKSFNSVKIINTSKFDDIFEILISSMFSE
jgi:hypothetical protein